MNVSNYVVRSTRLAPWSWSQDTHCRKKMNFNTVDRPVLKKNVKARIVSGRLKKQPDGKNILNGALFCCKKLRQNGTCIEVS